MSTLEEKYGIEGAKAVKEYQRSLGRSGGAKNKGAKQPWMSKVGKEQMRKRWKRKKFVSEVVLEALGTGKGFSGPQLLTYLESNKCPCCYQYLMQVMYRMGIRLGPDRMYRLPDRFSQSTNRD